MTPISQPTCTGREETVQAYLDAALSPTDRAAFERHLAGCPACQAMLAGWQLLFAELDNMEMVAPLPNIVSQVMTHLPAPHRSPSWPTRWGWAGAALQILVGIWLVIQAWPGLQLLVQPYQDLWSLELLLTLPLVSLTTWLEEVGQTLLTFDLLNWTATPDYLGWNLSFNLTLGLVLACAWLISTGLLLRRQSPSFHNGGTSL